MDDHPAAPAQLAGLSAKLQEVKHENDHGALDRRRRELNPPTGTGSGRRPSAGNETTAAALPTTATTASGGEQHHFYLGG